VQQSAIISHYLPAIAAKFPATKFVCIQSTRCIENYPDKNLPTVFVYRDAELKASLIGPAAWSGVTSAEGASPSRPMGGTPVFFFIVGAVS
jgi:hypothetical protein